MASGSNKMFVSVDNLPVHVPYYPSMSVGDLFDYLPGCYLLTTAFFVDGLKVGASSLWTTPLAVESIVEVRRGSMQDIIGTVSSSYVIVFQQGNKPLHCIDNAGDRAHPTKGTTKVAEGKAASFSRE